MQGRGRNSCSNQISVVAHLALPPQGHSVPAVAWPNALCLLGSGPVMIQMRLQEAWARGKGGGVEGRTDNASDGESGMLTA